ncbi:AmpG family muropeptide MFS transporter [Chitinimonas koreensis]|uniref:AmpG family muropeptide MFS transporter n=1 Tax=Chitinimonas koreensis TaxID=356302 RepID=UPI0004041894|nr:AmpG family muropeptide MFS transporter [Chitinimonas koreensis]QNM96941.1 AmpG family muropeptide MFS transporter [Chitinimonas koreensis]
MHPTESWREALLNRRMLVCVFTGFSSGLPLYLLIQLLPAWLRSEQIDLKQIGLFALIQFPYTWKFLWSPLLDRYGIATRWLGRRRGWMAFTQLLLAASIPLFGWLDPQAQIGTVAMLAAAVALFSATQDIVLDAYRRELLPEAELGIGNAVHVNAYRIAGLIPGSLSLILADHLPWDSVFAITALFMLPGVLATLLLAPTADAAIAPPKTLQEAVVAPFREFIGRHGGWAALEILAFIFLYKLGDSMATALSTPFYLDMGFSKSEIGLVAKHAGLWPAVIGGILGGIWMVKLGINRALWLFGAVQLVAILGFALLAEVGHDLWLLGGVIGLEYLGVGLGTAAFVAFIARTTDPRYTATQFALFTSLAAVPRTLVSAAAGWLVEQMGWGPFFWFCFALGLPGMLLLLRVAPWNGDAPADKPQA